MNRHEDNTACAVFGEEFFRMHPEVWRLIMAQPDGPKRKIPCPDCGVDLLRDHHCEAGR